MPTYEYKCDACGSEFERVRLIMGAPIKRCPECGKAKVRRLISTGAGLIFKGSGFYITDYRDKSYTDKAKAESGGGGETKPAAEAKAGGAGKAETESDAPAKTEAKPAAAEPKPTASKSAAKPAKSESKPKKK